MLIDRYAIFVDAGYVYAEGGKLCRGVHNRKDLDLDVPGLRDYLNQIARDTSGLPNLRMYWYDAAPGAHPTGKHEIIAKSSNIKLRLGRIKSGRQKGVDALIYHDLITLAQRGAISDAFLVSGDEDLREGVRTVQEMGVRVTLIGIEPSDQRSNQSRELIQEADEHMILTRDDLTSLFSPARLPQDSTDSVESGKAAPSPADQEVSSTSSDDQLALARRVGAEIAEEVRSRMPLSTEFLREGRDDRFALIPRDIDKQLLNRLSDALDIRRLPEHLKRTAREHFRRSITEL